MYVCIYTYKLKIRDKLYEGHKYRIESNVVEEGQEFRGSGKADQRDYVE